VLGACQVQADGHIITPEAASVVRHVGLSFVSGLTREGITRTGRRCRLPLSHTLMLDNGPQYTATARARAGLVPLTTPAYSPHSNGLAEAFVKTVEWDYVDGAELQDAEGPRAPQRRLDRRLQHPGAPLGARDAEPGRLPGGTHPKLLSVRELWGAFHPPRTTRWKPSDVME
jgi:hypothetical protein